MLAGITRVSELEMEQEEASKLAGAMANVARHYDMQASAKAMDWTNLIFVAGSLYGTRFAAIRLRRIMEKAEAAEKGDPTLNPNPQTARPTGTGRVHIPGVGEVPVPLN